MKRLIILILLLLAVCIQFAFADTEISWHFTLPGEWEVFQAEDPGFSGGPTEEYGITPFAKAIREDGKYFGYFFAYNWGAMSGTGTPWEGDYESFPEWEDFGNRMEADFRSLLEKYDSDLRRQTFCITPGWEESFAFINSTGYAHFDNSRYGFTAIAMEADVAYYAAGFIFCNDQEFNENIEEMKIILGLEYDSEY